jgi:hypothetical protein
MLVLNELHILFKFVDVIQYKKYNNTNLGYFSIYYIEIVSIGVGNGRVRAQFGKDV